jgi:hypothetical protein
MASIDEIMGNPATGLADALAAGIIDLSKARDLEFDLYTRIVLPLDGFVFWLRSGDLTVKGVLHYTSDRPQDEDGTLTESTVVLTCNQEIVFLNASNTQTLIVGEVEGQKFAFHRHGFFFREANVWHYEGTTINANLSTQLIDDPSTLDPTQVIVSDSLPIWLQIASYSPIWLNPPNPMVQLFPSYLVPDNLPPIYGAVHHEPEAIRALQDAPLLRPQIGVAPGTPPINVGLLHNQLVSESVRVTLYGCNNAMAADFLDTVLRYSLDTDNIGIMNMPAIRDGKKGWADGMLIAQQKIIDFDISYVQNRAYAVATQLIASAQVSVVVSDG